MSDNEIRPIEVEFSESAVAAANMTIRALNLLPLMETIKQENTPQEIRERLQTLLINLADIFSVDLPDIDGGTEEALYKVSRDMSLSKLFRERGLFRLYRLTRETVDGIHYWSFFSNPLTGEPFPSREKFLDWFVGDAHIPRSLIYQRMADIDRLTSLGFELDRAYEIVLSKPYVISQALRHLASWDEDNHLEDVDPAVVLMTARKIADASMLPAITKAVKDSETDPDVRENMKNIGAPLLYGLMEELASHERAKDAMAFVKNDILLQPEIKYLWDDETPALLVTIVLKKLDPETQEEYEMPTLTIPFIPDVAVLPTEVRNDILKRLPIANRKFLDF